MAAGCCSEGLATPQAVWWQGSLCCLCEILRLSPTREPRGGVSQAAREPSYSTDAARVEDYRLWAAGVGLRAAGGEWRTGSRGGRVVRRAAGCRLGVLGVDS